MRCWYIKYYIAILAEKGINYSNAGSMKEVKEAVDERSIVLHQNCCT